MNGAAQARTREAKSVLGLNHNPCHMWPRVAEGPVIQNISSDEYIMGHCEHEL